MDTAHHERHYENGRFIYHMTALRNLPSIFRYGLRSRQSLDHFRAQDTAFVDIANPEIIAYRTSYHITSYIPFHFYLRTPCEYNMIHAHPDVPVAYIAIERSYAEASGFKIIPTHPMSGTMKYQPEVFDYNEGFQRIDWPAMNRRNYSTPVEKNACMAECVTDQPVDILSLARKNLAIFYSCNEAQKRFIKEAACQACQHCNRADGCLKIIVNPQFF